MKTNKVTDTELLKLLQDLIRIPSWVSDDGQNENELVDFLEDWLRKNTKLDVLRQKLPGNRYNLIASKGKPDLVFLAHTDTVKPAPKSKYNQFAAEVHNNKIWGLGSTDMKSGIAAMIHAIKLASDCDNIWLFLYADEEYDFLGMKYLVKEFGHIRPKMLVSSDGSDLKFGYGCRGLIEFRVRVYGERGHPAKNQGNSAIWGTFKALEELKKYLSKFTHPIMGGTSFNLASVVGGAELLGTDRNERLFKTGQAGNVVPDIMEFVIDIRPSSVELKADNIANVLEASLTKRGLVPKIIERTHNEGSWYTNPEELHKYVEIAKEVTGDSEIRFDDPGGTGYIDMQMLWKQVGSPPAFMFGGGFGDTAHEPDENISISALKKTRNFFYQVLVSRK